MIESIQQMELTGNGFRNRRRTVAAKITAQRGPLYPCAVLLSILTTPARSVLRICGVAGSRDRGRRWFGLYGWLGDAIAGVLTWAYKRRCRKMFPSGPKIPSRRVPNIAPIVITPANNPTDPAAKMINNVSTVLYGCIKKRWRADDCIERLTTYGFLIKTSDPSVLIITQHGVDLIDDFVNRRN